VDCEDIEAEAVTTGGRATFLFARTFKEGVVTEVEVTCNTIIGVYYTGSRSIQIVGAVDKSCQRSTRLKKSCPCLSNMPMSVGMFAEHCGLGAWKNGHLAVSCVEGEYPPTFHAILLVVFFLNTKTLQAGEWEMSLAQWVKAWTNKPVRGSSSKYNDPEYPRSMIEHGTWSQYLVVRLDMELYWGSVRSSQVRVDMWPRCSPHRNPGAPDNFFLHITNGKLWIGHLVCQINNCMICSI
jgi:hypothetical protein